MSARKKMDRVTPVVLRGAAWWTGNRNAVVHPEWEPKPGTMDLCKRCAHGRDSQCLSPLLHARGGSGITVKHPSVTVSHMAGATLHEYHGPPSSCSGQRSVARHVESSVTP